MCDLYYNNGIAIFTYVDDNEHKIQYNVFSVLSLKATGLYSTNFKRN